MPKANLEVKYRTFASPKHYGILFKLFKTPVPVRGANGNVPTGFIRHVYKEHVKNMNKVREEYERDLVEVFAEKDADGKVIYGNNEDGSVNKADFKIPEANEEKFTQAEKEFYQRTMIFEWGPLNPTHVAHVELSPEDLDILGELYTDEMGPGIPAGGVPVI